ncbi:MAG: ABC transporter permease, partial [Ruthenibacterium sp.]
MKEFFAVYGDMLIKALFVHSGYVLVSVAIGAAAGLLFGIALSRVPKYSNVILPILSVFQTIPGIVFIGILFLYLGMVPATVIIALSVYAMFPVLKNTYTGILGVEPRFLEAARGCGMSPMQVLLRVELPLALPAIFGGLRLATIYTVSWAVLAAMIGLGGFGDFIYQGVST